MTYEQMADDTASLLRKIRIERADFFGYSTGVGIVLHMAICRPDLVCKLVIALLAYNSDGFYSKVLEGEENMRPEELTGLEWE